MSTARTATRIGLVASLLTAAADGAVAQTVPTGFQIQNVVGPPFGGALTGFAFLPDGRIVLVEKDLGAVRLAPAAGGTSAVIATIPDVSVADERGLLGVAVDPQWPARPYLYFYLTHTSGAIRVVMYTATGDLADPTSTAIALQDPFILLGDIQDLFSNHNAGTLRFGPDGFLWVSTGDDSRGCDAQTLEHLSGKLLRLDVSAMPGTGSGPPPKSAIAAPGNPFSGPLSQLVFASGFRNPFRFTVDPLSNDVFIGDVGQETWEEIDVLRFTGGVGDNFGWPEFEGPLQDPVPGFDECSAGPFRGPIAIYPNPPGGGVSSVVCGPQYRTSPSAFGFPTAYEGDVFFTDFFARWIRRLHETPGGWVIADSVPGQPSVANWATNLGNIADLQQGPDGALYLLVMFTAGNLPGGLHRIVSTLPSDAGGPFGRSRLTARPNPASPAGVSLALATPTGTVRDVRIFDVAGRLVRTLASQARGRWHWDGRDAHGDRVRAGLYLARHDQDGTTSTCRIVVPFSGRAP